MKRRAIACLVLARTLPQPRQLRAVQHLHDLAERHQLTHQTATTDWFILHWVSRHQSTDSPSSRDPGETIELEIGPIAEQPVDWDRFLKVTVTGSEFAVESDYAGSIPAYYSARDGLALSTIEPCTRLASGTTLNDLSPENVYGFLRYSHFIWDETAWRHIRQTLPDHRLVLDASGNHVADHYLETVRASEDLADRTDDQIADDFFELNRALITRSLNSAQQILLPLSSGYDSRLIFCVLASDPTLQAKTRCFTYGAPGAIEVEAARRLASTANVSWQFIDLPCQFLARSRIEAIGDIFGASLHMHGMYQLEFFDQIRPLLDNGVPRLTSGFMTGVPAGQHNGTLRIHSNNDSLTTAMDHFFQSSFWPDSLLQTLPFFEGRSYLESAESRFRQAFDLFDGEVFQKAVMFDVWTRQRNFIGYYPRTFEWLTEVSSPHMNTDYASFFMSLSRDHLWDRRAVELMLLKHYPTMARIVSNSNGIKALGNSAETALFLLARLLRRLHLAALLPTTYRNEPIEFNLRATRHAGTGGFFPLLETNPDMTEFLELFGGRASVESLYQQAWNGDVISYCRLTTLQALAYDLQLDGMR